MGSKSGRPREVSVDGESGTLGTMTKMRREVICIRAETSSRFRQTRLNVTMCALTIHGGVLHFTFDCLEWENEEPKIWWALIFVSDSCAISVKRGNGQDFAMGNNVKKVHS